MAHVLIIDDEPMVRKTVRLVLESSGHSVVEAENGRVGVARYARERFDMVITDVLMPEREGIETIRLLRSIDPGVKILAMSGGGRTGNQEHLAVALESGASAALQKPFDPDDLADTVRRLCN